MSTTILCRLCYNELSELPDYIEVFGTTGSLLKCQKKITDLLHLKVHPDDEYTKSVCIECWQALDAFNEFYNQIHEIQATYLKDQYKSMVVNPVEHIPTASPFTIEETTQDTTEEIEEEVPEVHVPIEHVEICPEPIEEIVQIAEFGLSHIKMLKGNKLIALGDAENAETFQKIKDGKIKLCVTRLRPIKVFDNDGKPFVRRAVDIPCTFPKLSETQNFTKNIRTSGCKCSILDCNSTRRTYDRLFRFTTNHVHYEKVRLYMDPSVFKNKLMFICSKHFEECCFLNKNLRRTAMPTLHLPRLQCRSPKGRFEAM